jgi:hypothetical protein
MPKLKRKPHFSWGPRPGAEGVTAKAALKNKRHRDKK